MRSAENVFRNRFGTPPMTRFPVCFPQFTGRGGCGITSGRSAVVHSFSRTTLECSGRCATKFRLRPGFKTLRNGPVVVATPMALGASKEDAGKGGASPAPLPKVLHVHRGKPLAGFEWGSVRAMTGGGRRSEMFLPSANKLSPEGIWCVRAARWRNNR